jgi:hypothetical protein
LKDFGIKTLPLCQAFGQHDICEIHACQCLHSWLSQITLKKFSFGEVNFFLNVEACLGKENPYLAHFVVPNIWKRVSCWN